MAKANRATHILDLDRQRAIDEIRAKAVFAEVYWDFDADAWAIECRACGKPPQVITKERYLLTDKEIKTILVNRAVQHNQDKHHET